MNKKKYWDEVSALYDEVYDKADRQLKAEYSRLYEELEVQVFGLMYEYQQKEMEGKLTNNTIYTFNKFYKLMEDLQGKLQVMAKEEERIIDSSLKEMYEKTSKLVGETIGYNQPVSDVQTQQAIATTWCEDGKRFSERVWSNKGKMLEIIRKGIVDMSVKGVSRAQITKELMRECNVGYHAADRLVRTELNFANNKACLDTFIEAGIEKYRILTANDDRVCPVCDELSTKVFDVKDAQFGVNVPPIHPQCRDTLIAIIN